MSGAVMFMIMRMVVVLPAPLGPSRPNIAPFGTSSDRLSTALKRPKALQTFEELDRAVHGEADYYGILGEGFGRGKLAERVGFTAVLRTATGYRWPPASVAYCRGFEFCGRLPTAEGRPLVVG